MAEYGSDIYFRLLDYLLQIKILSLCDKAQTFGILEFTKCQLCFTFIRAVFRILSEN